MKMRLFRCLVVAAMLFSTTSYAQNKAGHKINGYKYLCMEQQGNLHDLEDKFNAFFAEIGFTILTPDDEEELSDDERLYVLYGSYLYNTVPDALDNMTLTLRNSTGRIIFSSTKEAACFVSVKRCAQKASDKIIQQIRALNYSFDPTLVLSKSKKKTIEDSEAIIESEDPSETEKEE